MATQSGGNGGKGGPKGSGCGPEAGSGGFSRDIDDEVLAAWDRTWEERERQAREILAERDGPGLAIRTNRDGTVVAYRPRQVIVAQRDLDRVADDLRRVGIDPEDPVATCDGENQRDSTDRRDRTNLFVVSPEVDVLSFVEDVIARCGRDEPAPAIGPNHVFLSSQHMKWGPGGEPEPDEGAIEVDHCEPVGEGVRIGVLDTGVWREWASQDVLRERLVDVDEPGDLDPLVDGRDLERDAGHGTFIAGIIAQRAPGAEVDPEATLDDLGMVDEYEITEDLPDVARCHILNMSFSGYSLGDRPPVELAEILDGLRPGIEVVAAAGNEGKDRPAWPAAHKRVTAVAAVGRDQEPAPFSNRGHWVDVCTYGVFERSTYVTGEYPRANGDVATFDEPVARWSGTSFAAPRFAAAVAAHMSETGLGARAASADLLANGDPVGGGFGVFVP